MVTDIHPIKIPYNNITVKVVIIMKPTQVSTLHPFQGNFSFSHSFITTTNPSKPLF